MKLAATPLRAWMLAAVIGGVVLLHFPTALQMHRFWSDVDNTTYTHGYLIFAIAIWLVWRSRKQLDNIVIQPTPAMIWALVAAEGAWLLAFQAGIQGACMMLLPLIIWLTLFSLFGPGIARVTILPLGYLYFALPVWSLINPLAQWGTIYAARLLLSAVGVDAFFEANLVHLQSGTFQIAGGCSGLHFIIVGSALAVLVGELRRDNLITRMKLTALALTLSVLSNWIRVTIIIFAGDRTHMQHYLVRVSHYGFGWCVFAVAMAIFFVLERRFEIGTDDGTAHKAWSWPSWARYSGASGRVWLATALTVAFPMGANALISSRQRSLTESLPSQVGAWSGPQLASGGDWQPVFIGADAEARARYQSESGNVEVYSAWYAQQEQGSELSGHYNSVFGALTPLDDGVVALSGSRPFNVVQMRAKASPDSILLWYGYAVGERWFSNPTRAQLWYAFQTLTQVRPPVSRVFAVRASCGADCSGANHLIADFLEQVQ